MFVCGPTVQSRIHLGHARTYIFYDALARYLSYRGYDVFYLMNITDIDESVSRAAAEAGQEPLAYSEGMVSRFLQDLASLNITTITRFEAVSRHIEDMKEQVATLLSKGYGYQVDGWVYFDTSKFRRWGRLSHQSRRDLSLRPLELSPKKKNLVDFALWRPETLVRGRWDSPWGLGSPGWHVQDTGVTIPILGAQYDIHGGAYELIYPHHEAQIAQAESLTGVRPFVRYWVHTNLLNMEGQKMSKSVGNVVTVEKALERWSADELRFYFLSIHHREETDLSGLGRARKRLAEMRKLASRVAGPKAVSGRSLAGFESALNDDFDSPKGLRWSEYLLRAAAKERSPSKASELAWTAVDAMRILGVDLLTSP
jgi:cysteinyl-tRNA synthetase